MADAATVDQTPPADDPATGGSSRAHLSPQASERLADILKAVSDPTRLRLLSVIRTAPAGEACVQGLAEALDLTQPTVSRHLKILVVAGLLQRQQRGKWAWYRIAPERAAAVRSLLE